MAARRAKETDKTVPVADYEHVDSTRVNNPPAGLAHLDRADTPVRKLSFDPHFDPQLVWAGKEERSEVEVPAPSIHVHEELSAQKIVGSVRRQRLQQPLFDVDKLDPDQAVEFYKHDLDWSNRMILGDSLTVMTSLGASPPTGHRMLPFRGGRGDVAKRYVVGITNRREVVGGVARVRRCRPRTE